MPKALESLICELELLVRNARGELVQTKIKEIKRSEISKDQLNVIAMMAVRSGIPDYALTLLKPVVRPLRGLPDKSTPLEKMVYGSALLRLGADSEAKHYLSKVSSTEVPRSLFFLGILALKDWDYAQAAELFRSYLNNEKDKYNRFTAKLNLGQSLIVLNDFVEAEQTLLEGREYAEIHRLEIHRGNALSYLGALEFYRKNLEKSQRYIEEAIGILQPIGGLDLFFAKKWRVLIDLFRLGMTPQNQLALEAIRMEALQRNHWVSLRDIDFHVAVLTQDRDLVFQLYFGTPNVHFRARLQQAFPDVKLPDFFIRTIGTKKAAKMSEILDLAEEQRTKNKGFLKAGQTLHRLYTTLTQDAYRRFDVVTLFEKLFVGQHYSLGSSDLRVRQTVKLRRKWFVDHSVPLSIEVETGFYYLKSTRNCGVMLRIYPVETSSLSSGQTRLNLLREKLPSLFAVSQVMGILDLSRSGALKTIQNAIEAGEIESIGSGRGTKYRFTERLLKKTG